jgi:hypothetical protein
MPLTDGNKQWIKEELYKHSEEDLFLMSNLSPRRTGLPFVVWISPRGNARHDVRVKVSPSPKTMPDEFVVVAIRPEVKVLFGSLSATDLALLTKWIDQNLDVLVQFWEGNIEYTEDVLKALVRLEEK